MQLKDFVSETISQIIEGVETAQRFGARYDALVNPHGLETNADYRDEATGEAASLVEFDVAITADEARETKGGIGVFVAAVALGSQGQSGTSTSTVSRVKFAVPVHLPKTKALKEKEEKAYCSVR